MLTQYGGYPAFDLMYDKGGHPVDPDTQDEALSYFASGAGKTTSDIIVISHGWNNDIADARTLYHLFFNAFAPVARDVAKQRTFAIIALFWPSKRFAKSALIPGGAAGLQEAAVAKISAQLDQFAALFADDPQTAGRISHLRSLIPVLDVSISAQDDYVATLVSMIPKPRYEGDGIIDDARKAIETTPGHVVLSCLSTPTVPASALIPGRGGAEGIENLLSGITSAAASFGDLLTYYTMKDRSGIVGRTGVVDTIRAFLKQRSAAALPKIHLVGHSFGARLVTAAANALNGQGAGECVDSMTLLEAAYSDNGLAQNWDGRGHDGAFRSVISAVKVRGPILITHSSHDFPVGVAYPLASRLMGQVAQGLIGGPNDIYGGMGRNGAQHTPEVLDDVPLLPAVPVPKYPVRPGRPCWCLNIRGDGPPPEPTITGHSDIAKPEIASAMLAYI